VVQYSSNNEGILGLVACGMGVSIQAESIRTYVRNGVVIRAIDCAGHEMPTIGAWREEPMSTVKDRLVRPVKALSETPAGAGRAHR
jgi:hypothetical protein